MNVMPTPTPEQTELVRNHLLNDLNEQLHHIGYAVEDWERVTPGLNHQRFKAYRAKFLDRNGHAPVLLIRAIAATQGIDLSTWRTDPLEPGDSDLDSLDYTWRITNSGKVQYQVLLNWAEVLDRYEAIVAEVLAAKTARTAKKRKVRNLTPVESPALDMSTLN
jgi:hypothetical protein